MRFDSLSMQGFEQTQVSHDRNDDRIVGQLALFFHALTGTSQNIIPIQHAAQFVAENSPVAISVKSDAAVGLSLQHQTLHFLRMLRSPSRIDVAAVRRSSDG